MRSCWQATGCVPTPSQVDDVLVAGQWITASPPLSMLIWGHPVLSKPPCCLPGNSSQPMPPGSGIGFWCMRHLMLNKWAWFVCLPLLLLTFAKFTDTSTFCSDLCCIQDISTVCHLPWPLLHLCVSLSATCPDLASAIDCDYCLPSLLTPLEWLSPCLHSYLYDFLFWVHLQHSAARIYSLIHYVLAT